MIEQDLVRLTGRDDVRLDGLAPDIWRREAETRSMLRLVRQMTALQAAVIFVAVLSSASVGLSRAAASHRDHTGLFARADLSPETLLLGGKK